MILHSVPLLALCHQKGWADLTEQFLALLNRERKCCAARSLENSWNSTGCMQGMERISNIDFFQSFSNLELHYGVQC